MVTQRIKDSDIVVLRTIIIKASTKQLLGMCALIIKELQCREPEYIGVTQVSP